jgi:hypothetical protein
MAAIAVFLIILRRQTLYARHAQEESQHEKVKNRFHRDKYFFRIPNNCELMINFCGSNKILFCFRPLSCQLKPRKILLQSKAFFMKNWPKSDKLAVNRHFMN